VVYDSILIGSGPVNLIEAMYLSNQGKKVLVLEQGDYIGGAWGKVPLESDLPDFQLGCHIWDIEPTAFQFLSKFLDIKLTKMNPQPEFVIKGIKFPYDWKNLLFYVRGKLKPKSGMERVNFNKARIIPAKYVYPEGGSLQFIDRLLEKVKEFDVQVATGVKINKLDLGEVCKAVSGTETYEAKEIVLTSVSQLKLIIKNEEVFNFPEPRLVDYIHGHLLIKDSTPTKFSYARLPGNSLIHRVSDETDHLRNHGVNMHGNKLILAGILPEMYKEHSKDVLAEMLMDHLVKRKYIGKNAKLIKHFWNVFSTHYIPKEIRPEITSKFHPNIRLLNSTNFIYSIRDNCSRWSKVLLN